MKNCLCGAPLIEARTYKVSATNKPRNVGRERLKIQQKVKNLQLSNNVLSSSVLLLFLICDNISMINM